MMNCDVLIRNAAVLDGSGTAAVRGDVAVVKDRIVAVGPELGWRGAETVDADVMVLSP